MSSVRRASIEAVRDAAWARPEWWLLGLGAGSWIVMLVHGVAHWGHTHHHVMSAGEELALWLLMVIAMMLPSLVRASRAIAFRSYAERRHLAIAELLLGYLAVWGAVGAVVVGLHAYAWSRTHMATAAFFAAAAAWALVPLRASAMQIGHGYVPVLAPSGFQADWDCVKAGVEVGAWCVLSCWPAMMACGISGHAMVAMVIGALVGAAETASFRAPSEERIATAFAGAAAYFALL
jgi:predicted metal-binding membrane protein